MFNPARIRFQYYKDMHSAVLAAVDNDDTQPLRKFYKNYFPGAFNTIDINQMSDDAINYAARIICTRVPSIPMKEKEKAYNWIQEHKMEVDFADETAYILDQTDKEKVI